MRRAPIFLAIVLAATSVVVGAPPASAQLQKELVSFTLEAVDPPQWVPYLGEARFGILIRDLSRDAVSEGSVGAQPGLTHMTTLDADFVDVPANASTMGWETGLTNTTIFSSGGMTRQTTLVVQATGPVTLNYVTIRVTGTMQTGDGKPRTAEAYVTAYLEPFRLANVNFKTPPKLVEQQKVVNYVVQIENVGTYIDTFLLNVSITPGWKALIQPRVVIEPKSTALVNISIQSPSGQLWHPGEAAIISVSARSIHDPSVAFTGASVIMVDGPYISALWRPLVALSLVAFGLLTVRAWQDRDLAALEKGRPRKPRPTPRETVLLAALAKRDPPAWRARKAAQLALWRERRRAYRIEMRARRRAERKLLREERRELRANRAKMRKATKLRRKAEKLKLREEAKKLHATRKSQKAEAKIARKDAKRQAKVDAKEAKRLAKVAKNKEKALAATRKTLDKARATADRAETRAAKVAKRAAKRGRKGS